MATKIAKPTIHIEHCTANNTAASVSSEAALALQEAARAAAANADAIAEIAKALKGVEAKMDAGFRFGL